MLVHEGAGRAKLFSFALSDFGCYVALRCAAHGPPPRACGARKISIRFLTQHLPHQRASAPSRTNWAILASRLTALTMTTIAASPGQAAKLNLWEQTPHDGFSGSSQQTYILEAGSSRHEKKLFVCRGLNRIKAGWFLHGGIIAGHLRLSGGFRGEETDWLQTGKRWRGGFSYPRLGFPFHHL